MAQFTIQLEDELAALVESAAARSGLPVAEVVRDALRDHIQKIGKPESLLAKAKRLGVVGIVDDLPRDLSSNKSHFEGFGE